jgi:hypothetical protein
MFSLLGLEEFENRVENLASGNDTYWWIQESQTLNGTLEIKEEEVLKRPTNI